MRHSFALLLLAVSLTSSGCALIEDAARNTLVEVCRPLQEHKEKKRNRRWADEAWQQVQPPYSGGCLSADYAAGFKDGYAEYLFRGGDGEPPVVAPLRYRQVKYQTPQGYQAVQDWFAGYRHGAQVARNSGAREVITGPSALQFASVVDPGHQVVPFVRQHYPMPLEGPPPTPLMPYYPAPQPREYSPPNGAPLPPSEPPVYTPLPREAAPLRESVPPRPIMPSANPSMAPFEVYPLPEPRYAPEHTPGAEAGRTPFMGVQAQFGSPLNGESERTAEPEDDAPNWTATTPLRLHLGLPSAVDLPTSPPIAPEDIDAVKRAATQPEFIPEMPPVKRTAAQPEIILETPVPIEQSIPRETPEPPTRDPMKVDEPKPSVMPEPPEPMPQDPLIFAPKPSIEIQETLEFAKPKKMPTAEEPAIIQPAPLSKPAVPESLLFTLPLQKVEMRTAPEFFTMPKVEPGSQPRKELRPMSGFIPPPRTEPRLLPKMEAHPLIQTEPESLPKMEAGPLPQVGPGTMPKVDAHPLPPMAPGTMPKVDVHPLPPVAPTTTPKVEPRPLPVAPVPMPKVEPRPMPQGEPQSAPSPIFEPPQFAPLPTMPTVAPRNGGYVTEELQLAPATPRIQLGAPQTKRPEF